MSEVEPYQQLIIPDKVKVGYQKRSDTYTANLGFVVYYDNKGKLRKENAWEGWRDKKIKPKEFKNEPTEGFVINRNIGGVRHSWGWYDHARIEKVRVYDPRDFEIEITIPNLLYLLGECDCSRGKGLEGKLVYAWRGQELMLLPAESNEYKASKNFTDLQTKGVHSRDMVAGHSYLTKKEKVLTFLGRFDYYFMVDKDGYRTSKKDMTGICKKYVFWDGKELVLTEGLKDIAVLQSDQQPDNFAALVKKYYKSEHGSPVKKIFLQDVPDAKPNQTWFYEDNGVFVQCRTEWTSDYEWVGNKRVDRVPTINKITFDQKYTFKDGIVTKEYFLPKDSDDHYRYYRSAYSAPTLELREKIRRDYSGYRNQHNIHIEPYRVPTNQVLVAQLESGVKIQLDGYNPLGKDNGK
jgi:hypothetical protein